MRPIDAVALTEGIELHRQSTDQEYEVDRQWAVGYNAGLDRALYSIAYAKTIAPPPNDPLTLDELRKMDGEPVWIVEYPDWGHWELSHDAEDYIQDRQEEFYGMKHDDPDGRFGLHALGWFAYRRKPEEGMA